MLALSLTVHEHTFRTRSDRPVIDPTSKVGGWRAAEIGEETAMTETDGGQAGPPDERTATAIAVLAKDVGTWDTELEIHPGPGADPDYTTGVTTNRLVGGRWLVTDHVTTSGFEGHGIYGWDPVLGRYVGAWVDSMGGGIARGEGTWDAATRTMTYEVAVDYQGTTVRYREITQTIDGDTQLYRNLVPTPAGAEFEAIRATYRRR